MKSVDLLLSLFEAVGLTMERVTECEVQQFIRERFAARGLVTTHAPIAAVNANVLDPHYMPQQQRTSVIEAGSLVLIISGPSLMPREPSIMT